MKKQIIKKSIILLLTLTLALCNFSVLPSEEQNTIPPTSIFDSNEPKD